MTQEQFRPIRMPDGQIVNLPEVEAALEDEDTVDDGISDLFTVDANPDTSDLVSVDIEEDIIDADEDGSLDSLTEVTEEDVMGDEIGQIDLDYKPEYMKPRPQQRQPLRPRTVRYVPPYPRMGGIRQ